MVRNCETLPRLRPAARAEMTSLLTLFLLVFLLNVLPAFAPPTWMLLSFFGLRFPDANPWWVALVAASAATSGRTALAYFAQCISDSRWFPESMRANLGSVAEVIERRRATSSVAILLFAIQSTSFERALPGLRSVAGALATVGGPVLRRSLRELRLRVHGRRSGGRPVRHRDQRPSVRAVLRRFATCVDRSCVRFRADRLAPKLA